jgi:two-component system NtrC family sensor kinase
MVNVVENTLSLRWRITAVLLVVSLLPIVLSGAASWLALDRLLQAKALEQMRQMVRGHAHSIESYLNEHLHLMELLALSQPDLRRATPQRLQELLAELDRSSPGGFVDLGVIDADGRHLAYAGPYELQACNYRATDWFQEVMTRGRYVSDVFLGFRNVPHCIIAVKTADEDGDLILRATINSERFNAIVRASELGATAAAYLLNRTGQHQTDSPHGPVLSRAAIEDLQPHPGVREQWVQADGVRKVRASTWLEDGRWLLVVELDVAAIRAPLKQVTATEALIVLPAAVLMVITALAATTHLTRRIDRANAQRQEALGAFLRSAKLASIGELATGLAHEINNPLAIISTEQTNLADLLAEAPLEEQRRQEMLAAVERSRRHVYRCARITQKMLQFGRKADSTLRPTDIGPRLAEIVNLLQPQARTRNVELALEVPDHLPQALLDPLELEQVLVNLIQNSFDALPDGGCIRVAAHQENGRVVVQVQDNGTGIAPANLERIFEPFFTTKPAGQGTGLGLAVCYGIVSSWGGSIEATSAAGRGTTLTVSLPVPGSAGVDDGSARLPPRRT